MGTSTTAEDFLDFDDFFLAVPVLLFFAFLLLPMLFFPTAFFSLFVLLKNKNQ